MYAKQIFCDPKFPTYYKPRAATGYSAGEPGYRYVKTGELPSELALDGGTEVWLQLRYTGHIMHEWGEYIKHWFNKNHNA